MSDFLPRDLLIDVFTTLPIKTLVRCACVCKSWYSLVTNPSFITTHLNRSSLANNNNNNLLLLNRSCYGGFYEDHYSLLRCENETFCDHKELEPPLKSSKDHNLRIVGNCNGLVCLSSDMRSYEEKIYLWNPTIHKTMVLPPFRVSFRTHGALLHAIGFGFDSLTDDYKVVRVVNLDALPDIRFRTPPEVDIFSLSRGTWRNIGHLGLPLYPIYDRAPQAFLNGAAHWLAKDGGRRRGGRMTNFFSLIISFHMSDEVFGEIMAPSSIFRDNPGEGVRVAKFQESLSLIVGVRGSATCCIWVMKEYGKSESWTKQYNIEIELFSQESLSVSGGLVNIVARFTKKGEVLFGTKTGYMVTYDPQAKRVTKKLFIRWLMDLFYVDSYTESLVLLGAKFRDTVTCEGSSVKSGKRKRVQKL